MNHASAKGEGLPTSNDSLHRRAGAEAGTIVAKRLVFHLGGYDPITPYIVAQRRFVRELARFERTWSAKASMGALDENADQAKWSVITKGPNWQVESDYRLVRWDDVIEDFSGQTVWRRVPLGIIAFLDFIWSGALWGYLRTKSIKPGEPARVEHKPRGGYGCQHFRTYDPASGTYMGYE